MSLEISDIYKPILEGLNTVDDRLRSLVEDDSSPLRGLVEHVLGQTGKRLRPAVTLLVGKTCGCALDTLAPMAIAVELFHTATLVHDDTVDGSSLRRGKPTVNDLWGEGRAVLFGDYMFAVAAELASTTGNLQVVTLFAETLRAVSSGELRQSFKVFDLSQSRKRYYESIASKTASLFVLATESAAILSHTSEEVVVASREYGYNLGMAFQIVDDILDFVGIEEELGKPVGADLFQGIVTLPLILAIERNPRDSRAIQVAERRDEGSIRAILEMAGDPSLLKESYKIASEFCSRSARAAMNLPSGKTRDSLVALTEYVTERKV